MEAARKTTKTPTTRAGKSPQRKATAPAAATKPATSKLSAIAKTAAAMVAAQKGKARPTEFDAKRIKILRENPCHPASAVHARYATYKNGMTVGEQVAKWGPVARGDIREHARRKWIAILD